jgi:hypothetical protein
MRKVFCVAVVALVGCAPMAPLSPADLAFMRKMQLEQQRASNEAALDAQRAFLGTLQPRNVVNQAAPAAPSQRAGMAFLKSSYISGQNRICIYDRLGSQEAHTVASFELCPINK